MPDKDFSKPVDHIKFHQTPYNIMFTLRLWCLSLNISVLQQYFVLVNSYMFEKTIGISSSRLVSIYIYLWPPKAARSPFTRPYEVHCGSLYSLSWHYIVFSDAWEQSPAIVILICRTWQEFPCWRVLRFVTASPLYSTIYWDVFRVLYSGIANRQRGKVFGRLRCTLAGTRRELRSRNFN